MWNWLLRLRTEYRLTMCDNRELRKMKGTYIVNQWISSFLQLINSFRLTLDAWILFSLYSLGLLFSSAYKKPIPFPGQWHLTVTVNKSCHHLLICKSRVIPTLRQNVVEVLLQTNKRQANTRRKSKWAAMDEKRNSSWIFYILKVCQIRKRAETAQVNGTE